MFASELPLGKFRFDYLRLEASLRNFCLLTFAWELWLENFRAGNSAWQLLLESFCLGHLEAGGVGRPEAGRSAGQELEEPPGS